MTKTGKATNEIVSFIDKSGIEESKAKMYRELLTTYTAKIDEYSEIVDSLVIAGIDDVENMRQAREGRLMLKNMRLECAEILGNKRTDVKKEMESFVNEDKTLLKLTQTFDAKFKDLETKLLDKEKFAEKIETDRKAKLKADRTLLIEPYRQYGINPDMYDLANMPDDAFQITFAGIEAVAKKRIEEKRIEEEKRQAEIDAEKERQRLRDAELVELKKQQEEKEREAEAERKKIAAEKELQSSRIKELWQYNKFVPDVDFSTLYELEDGEYKKILADAKLLFDVAEKERLKEIEDQKAAQKLIDEEKEQARIKQAEADAIIKAQQEKEAKEAAERERLESGSDKEKLLAYAATFRNIAHGQVTPTTQKGKYALSQFKIAYNQVLDDFDKSINKL